MNTPSAPPSPAALLREADARMAQALDNFFQRSRSSIQDIAFRALPTQATASDIETGQTCLDWLDAYPEALSTAFADQFRSHLARPETFTRHRAGHPSELQLVDDHTLKRRLAEEMAAAYMTEILRAEMLLLFGRLEAVQRAALEDPDQNHADLYGPLPVVRALSRALDALRICEGPATEVDLILSDIVMPEINGRELVDRVRGRRPGVKSLFMSGYSAEVISEKCVLDDGTHFIQKPFTVAALSEKITAALQG